jgi:hypothetical protein
MNKENEKIELDHFFDKKKSGTKSKFALMVMQTKGEKNIPVISSILLIYVTD